jgi:hypothetical protein
MLYYHLLLARLEARDELGRPSYERGRERVAAPSPERRSFLGRSGR